MSFGSERPSSQHDRQVLEELERDLRGRRWRDQSPPSAPRNPVAPTSSAPRVTALLLVVDMAVLAFGEQFGIPALAFASLGLFPVALAPIIRRTPQANAAHPSPPREDLPDITTAGHGDPVASLVVGFDQDATSRAALQFAVDLGTRLQARLHLVHVTHLSDFPVNLACDDWEQQGEQTLAAQRAYVERALQSYPFGWSYAIWHGEAATALASAAEQRDALMVIVGRHRRGMGTLAHRFVDGSVSRRLPGRSGRPVVVVAGN